MDFLRDGGGDQRFSTPLNGGGIIRLGTTIIGGINEKTQENLPNLVDARLL